MKRLASLAFTAILLLGVAQLPAASAAVTNGLPPIDAAQIQISYGKLTSEYYKKTDAQLILNGARSELSKALSQNGVKAALPPMFASTNAKQNVSAVDREVVAASRDAGKKVNAHLLSYAAIAGMLGSVHDRYTVFLNPKEYAALNSGLDGGSFSGTGIVIQADDQTKYIDVSNVVPDGPADKAGVQQDDVITAIDGKSAHGLTLQQASTKLRGNAGTKVSLSILRDGHALPSPISVTRATVHELSVYEKMLPGKIGYVELTVFGRDTGSELTTALDRLQKEGARAIVMDLRDNGGGYLEAAVAVSSKFIPSGPIVSVESRASNITTLEADNTAIGPLPLAVLVNGHTASASEITSGAIQDSGVGTIVGTKTFGKGVVQTIFPLPDGSAVKITTARYLTPRNRDINHLGIQPDIKVAENKTDRFGVVAKDTQLQRAINFLNDKLAHMGAPPPPASSGNSQ
ncbi:MAG TPA: S41 family peptidase [Candidatus Baltobacteraceae bacterium]